MKFNIAGKRVRDKIAVTVQAETGCKNGLAIPKGNTNNRGIYLSNLASIPGLSVNSSNKWTSRHSSTWYCCCGEVLMNWVNASRNDRR